MSHVTRMIRLTRPSGLSRAVITAVFLAAMSPIGGAWATETTAETSSVCEAPGLADLPIQAEGRVMALEIHARKVRKTFLSDTCQQLGPARLYCYVSLGRRAEAEKRFGCEIGIEIRHERLRKALGLATLERDAAPVSLALLEEKRFVLTSELRAAQLDETAASGYVKSLEEVAGKLDRVAAIERGEDWRILLADGEWRAIQTVPDSSRTEEVILGSSAKLDSDGRARLSAERAFDRFMPFKTAGFVSLLAFFLAVFAVHAPRVRRAAWIGAGAVLAIEITGIALRSYIAGRAPVATMYETVMWSGFGALILGLYFAWRHGLNRMLAFGLGLNLICLFMMSFATSMLDGDIRPLAPVLRDNFWLSTHVTSITLSYSGFLVSWAVANLLLVKASLRPVASPLFTELTQVIRISMQVGSVLLAAGIILGGIWADYSWGRFWGWDPKETWSLIVLVIYMIILHAKYVGWFRGYGFVIAASVGFLFVLMAWFGVNYLLSAGLHSYGFSQGGAGFMALIFGIQTVILIGFLASRRQSSAEALAGGEAK